jgi:hypothetical protein
VDAFLSGNPDLIQCTNFGPLERGGTAPYAIDAKFPVGSEVTVFMFSTPVELFSGEVPASRSVALTVPTDAAIGRHKFIQYGQDAEGNFRVGGCVTDVLDVKGSTQANNSNSGGGSAAGSGGSGTAAASGATPNSRTGAQIAGLLVGGTSLLLAGWAMVVLGRRRRRIS